MRFARPTALIASLALAAIAACNIAPTDHDRYEIQCDADATEVLAPTGEEAGCPEGYACQQDVCVVPGGEGSTPQVGDCAGDYTGDYRSTAGASGALTATVKTDGSLTLRFSGEGAVGAFGSTLDGEGAFVIDDAVLTVEGRFDLEACIATGTWSRAGQEDQGTWTIRL